MPSSITITRKSPDALKKLRARLGEIAKREVAVGFFADQEHPVEDGPPIKMAYLAAIHVFGMGVPERNFMGQARAGIIDRTRPIMMEIAKMEVKGYTKTADTLRELAGQEGAAGIRDAIVDGHYQPLARATIEARNEKRNNTSGIDDDKPLIDTGLMSLSPTHHVRDKE